MDRGTWIRVWLPLATGLCAVWVIFTRGSAPRDAIRWIGLGLALIGLAGATLARYTLGRLFSIRAKATALVTRGIYSRIRNPIYVSGVAFFVGLVLLLRRPVLGLLLLIVIPMQIIRARREAQVLEEKFGDAYREYRARTWL